MNKRHHSGLSCNVHCLSVNPSLSQLSSLPSDQRQLHFASTEDLEVDNNCDFEPANDEQIDNAREITPPLQFNGTLILLLVLNLESTYMRYCHHIVESIYHCKMKLLTLSNFIPQSTKLISQLQNCIIGTN